MNLLELLKLDHYATKTYSDRAHVHLNLDHLEFEKKLGGRVKKTNRRFLDSIVRAKILQNTYILFFSVTPFKIDQNKNQNNSIDKVQNLGKERR